MNLLTTLRARILFFFTALILLINLDSDFAFRWTRWLVRSWRTKCCSPWSLSGTRKHFIILYSSQPSHYNSSFESTDVLASYRLTAVCTHLMSFYRDFYYWFMDNYISLGASLKTGVQHLPAWCTGTPSFSSRALCPEFLHASLNDGNPTPIIWSVWV